MKYALYDIDGKFYQYCNDSTITELPANAIEMTDEQWENRFYLKKDMSTGGIVTYNPSSQSLEQMKARKESEIRAIGAARMIQIVSPYRAEERDTWFRQLKQAEDYLSGINLAPSMLSALVLERGNTLVDQANRIVANAAAYDVAVGTILGIQQAKIDQIQAATTVEGVAAIVWGV